MIIVKDALRCKVEAESQGRRTVLYTASGQPSYMHVIPRFTLQEVTSGLGEAVHPAFIVNGQRKEAFFYGCYPGTLIHGELVSQPETAPASWHDLAAFRQAAARNGRGWHIGTNAEWAALMFWCRRHGWPELGNTESGRSHRDRRQYGKRCDGGAVGDEQGDPTTFTASGPAAWYHDGTPHGIGDLCGNLWEWQHGLKLVAGEILLLPDNDAAMPMTDDEDERWRAVDLATGEWLPPGSPGTAKFDASSPSLTGNAGTPRISDRIRHFNGDPHDNGYPPGLMDDEFGRIGAASGESVPDILKILGVVPHHRCADGDQVYLRNYGERMLMRGGAWYSGAGAGLRTLCLSHGAGHASATVGARPVWCL
ncbi:hypothetical protein [Serratia ureilytica]|uniref:hypothetical protein n=1 Tax=Serratia ureilytica TaxID=300181 RepID=UPI003FA6E366